MEKLKNFIERNSKRFIILFSGLLLLVGLINFYFLFEVRVQSNDECLWTPKRIAADSTAIYFEKVKVEGVAWTAGIRNGDQLLEINNKRLSGTFQAQSILNHFNADEYAPYLVKKESGELLETKVRIKKLIIFPLVGAALLGAIWLFVAFVAVLAKPEGSIQRLFYKIGAAFILALSFVMINGPNSLPVPLLLIIDMAWSFAALFLPFLLVRFFWVFPKPFRFMEKKWVNKFLFFTPLILFILSVIVRTVFIYREPNAEKFYNPFTGFIQLLLLIAVVVSLTSLAINYFKLKNKEDRKPLFFILAAYALAFASIIYTIFVAPAISDTIFNSPEFYMPVIIIAILPVSFGYSIFRYQLMDVSVVIKNTIIYGAATLTIAAIYFLVIYVLGQTISSAIGTEYQGIIAGIIFISFAILFQSTKDKFQDFLTAKFYPEQFAYQKVLMSFINDIATYVGLDTILDSMKKTFVHALRLEQFGILLKDEKNGSFHLVRSEGLHKTDLKLHSENLYDFIENRQKVAKLPVVEWEDFAEVFPDNAEELQNEKIYTVIPMIVKSKVIGLLLFGLKHSGSQFAGKDVGLLYAAANQSAISIENARLYKSEAEKHRIERDLDLARKIQQGLLPKCIPSMSGLDICGQMVPAMQVGGDYFDLLPVSDSEIFIVVGDVSGKGLSAALYMTKLQTMIQIACIAGKTPKEILVDINKRMYESIERSWFVTMTLALFDTEKRTVKFCRAGHMPILISKNGMVESYRTQGIGVGLERGIIFERTLIEEEIKLTPGQMYSFFSDGITEAMNESQELFGEDKLSAILKNKGPLRSTEIMNEIWDEIVTYRGTAEQNDDMTMVIVKVN